jgi:hypothetical protein
MNVKFILLRLNYSSTLQHKIKPVNVMFDTSPSAISF